MEIKYLYPRERYRYNSEYDEHEYTDGDDTWDNSYQDTDPDTEMEALGHCCGAGFHADATEKTKINSKYGIDIFPGKLGKGVSTKAHERAHVSTKNGDLTVCIRLIQFADKDRD
jgi:hypothetical protein